jgi:hypothetical protein
MSVSPGLRACVLVLSGVLWLSGCGAPEPQTGGSEQLAQVQAAQCQESPAFQYVSRDPELCLTISFVCGQGQRQFFNDCGCGCRGRP